MGTTNLRSVSCYDCRFLSAPSEKSPCSECGDGVGPTDRPSKFVSWNTKVPGVNFKTEEEVLREFDVEHFAAMGEGLASAFDKQMVEKTMAEGLTLKVNENPALDTSVNVNKMNTGIETKKANFEPFMELVRNQFWHGGDKYALNGEKEFTDAICECFPGDSGVDWVLGTCMKYLGRYKNFGREKDLLKIATYMYILWLKGGFHTKEAHDEDTKR